MVKSNPWKISEITVKDDKIVSSYVQPFPFLFQHQKNGYLFTQAADEVSAEVPVSISPKHKNLNSWHHKMLMARRNRYDLNQENSKVCKKPLSPSGMAAEQKQDLLACSQPKEWDVWVLHAHMMWYDSVAVPAIQGLTIKSVNKFQQCC